MKKPNNDGNNPKNPVSLKHNIAKYEGKLNETDSHEQVLLAIIDSMTPYDFEVELKNQAKDGVFEKSKMSKGISNTELHVIIVDEVLKNAKKLGHYFMKEVPYLHLYNGAYWRVLEDVTIGKFMMQCASAMGVPQTRCAHYLFIQHMIEQLHSTVNVSPKLKNQEHTLLNLKSGTLEIGINGEVKSTPFNPKHYLKYQLNFDYDPNQQAPIFQKYLNHVLPQEDGALQRILSEYMGTAFIRDHKGGEKIEKSLILYGEGVNGKSVFFEIMRSLYGPDNIGHYSLDALTDKKGYQRAAVQGKLINYSSEMSKNMDSSVYKQIVSGEPVEARLPYLPPFLVYDFPRLVINANFLPQDAEQSKGYFRRFILVPFNVTIPDHEQDNLLHKKIITNEMPGVLNWVIQGLLRYRAQKSFTKASASEELLQQFMAETNPVVEFLEENGFQQSKTMNMALSDLFKDYVTYTYESRHPVISKTEFSKRMRKLGYQMARRNSGQIIFLEKKVL